MKKMKKMKKGSGVNKERCMDVGLYMYRGEEFGISF